jgi:hypothetical protein
MDITRGAQDDLAWRREVHMRHAKAIQLHAPSAAPELAITAFVLAVLVASAALFWGVFGLGG